MDGLNLRQLETLAPPNFRRFVESGLWCDTAYASVPLCAPARGAWLTGMEPHVNGQIENHFILDERVPTLIQAFSEAGWATALLGKQHSNTPELDGAFGYDHVLSWESPEFEELARSYAETDEEPWWGPSREITDQVQTITGVQFGGRVRHHSLDPDWAMLQEALSAVDSFEATGAPWLVNLQVLGPHHPYTMPEQFHFLYTWDDVPEWDPRGWELTPDGRYQMQRRRWDLLTSRQARTVIALQWGYVHYVDWLLGQLMDGLEDRGLLDDTLVVLTSDHGEMGGRKGLFLKQVMDDDALRVAFGLRHPSLPTGTYSGLVAGTDQLTTVAAMCGVKPAQDIQGMDLTAALKAGDPEQGRQHLYAWVDMILKEGRPAARGALIRSRSHKLVRFWGASYPDGPMEALYDMDADPDERIDVQLDEPVRTEAMHDTLTRYEKELPAALFPPTQVE